MNSVVHFEMPYDDGKRVAGFYTKAFGWEMKQLDEKYGDYVMAMTAESNEQGPLKPGAINGGFFKKTDDKPDQYPSVVLNVDDVSAKAKEVTAAGGEVLGEPMDIPGVGKYVSFRDTEGNRVGMLQPTEQK